MSYHAKNIAEAKNFWELRLCDISICNSPLTRKQKRTLNFMLAAGYRTAAVAYHAPKRKEREAARAKRKALRNGTTSIKTTILGYIAHLWSL